MITYVRILRPDFKRLVNGQLNYPTIRDYITVSRLSTYGQNKMVDLIPPEQLAALKILTNELERKRDREMVRRRHATR